MRSAVLALALLGGCAPNLLTFWDETRTVVYARVALEGDVGEKWAAPGLWEELECVREVADLDVSLRGQVVVTDDPETFRAYYEAWQPLGDPLQVATAFAWHPVSRGKQTLAKDADWIIIVYAPKVGDRTRVHILGHELLHVAGYEHDQGPWDSGWKESCESRP
jgi:hypothetical protein